jgi:hypothetical protein
VIGGGGDFLRSLTVCGPDRTNRPGLIILKYLVKSKNLESPHYQIVCTTIVEFHLNLTLALYSSCTSLYIACFQISSSTNRSELTSGV